jgi:hypothetical protein
MPQAQALAPCFSKDQNAPLETERGNSQTKSLLGLTEITYMDQPMKPSTN